MRKILLLFYISMFLISCGGPARPLKRAVIDRFPIGSWSGISFPTAEYANTTSLTVRDDGSYEKNGQRGTWHIEGDTLVLVNSLGKAQRLEMWRHSDILSDGYVDGLQLKRNAEKGR